MQNVSRVTTSHRQSLSPLPDLVNVGPHLLGLCLWDCFDDLRDAGDVLLEDAHRERLHIQDALVGDLRVVHDDHRDAAMEHSIFKAGAPAVSCSFISSERLTRSKKIRFIFYFTERRASLSLSHTTPGSARQNLDLDRKSP